MITTPNYFLPEYSDTRVEVFTTDIPPVSTGTSGTINQPYGVATDLDGNRYISSSNGYVTKVNSAGVIQWQHQDYSTDKAYGVAIDKQGLVWVAVHTLRGGVSNYGFFIYNSDGDVVQSFMHSDYSDISAQPRGLTVDPYGNVWATMDDAYVSYMIKMTKTYTWNEEEQRYDLTGMASSRYLGGIMNTGQENTFPIASDSFGNIYIVDNDFIDLVKYNNSGVEKGRYGLSYPATVFIGYSIAVDANDAIWVGGGNGRVAKVNNNMTLAWAGNVYWATAGHVTGLSPDANNQIWAIQAQDSTGSVAVLYNGGGVATRMTPDIYGWSQLHDAHGDFTGFTYQRLFRKTEIHGAEIHGAEIH